MLPSHHGLLKVLQDDQVRGSRGEGATDQAFLQKYRRYLHITQSHMNVPTPQLLIILQSIALHKEASWPFLDSVSKCGFGTDKLTQQVLGMNTILDLYASMN